MLGIVCVLEPLKRLVLSLLMPRTIQRGSALSTDRRNGTSRRQAGAKRPAGYTGSSAFLVSVPNTEEINRLNKSTRYLQAPVARELVVGTKSQPLKLPLVRRARRRGRPVALKIWEPWIVGWDSRFLEVSPDIDFPVGDLIVPDSVDRHGGRLRYALQEQISLDGTGQFYIELGYVPVSYPVVKWQQEKRDRVLRRYGQAHLAENAMGPRGMAFLSAPGFSDRPANLFSIRQRIAAFTDVGREVAIGVPNYAFSFATILAGVIDDFRNWNSYRVRALMDDVRLSTAASLRRCGATTAYVLGFWEVAEHRFPNSHVPIHDFLEHMEATVRSGKWRPTRIVLHLHLSILAHDGKDWIPVDSVKSFLEAASNAPHQIDVRSWPSFDLLGNLRRTTAYAEKPANEASDWLIVQDAVFRSLVQPDEQWPEGWLHLYAPSALPPVLRPNALRREKEIEKFTVFGAAGPFRESRLWWG